MRPIQGDAVSIKVGEAIRELRTSRGESLRALARASTLSANALSMIERGLASPSVGTLYRVAEALEVPISRLFQVDEKRAAVVFRKAAERTRLPISRGLWEGLGGESFDGRFEPMILTMESGCSSGPESMIHTGHEFVYCLRGVLEYGVEGEDFALEPGDSLLFRAHQRHRWRNPGPIVTQALIVLAGFEEGESPGRTHGAAGLGEGSPDDGLSPAQAEAVRQANPSVGVIP
jgi:transcriptional regulator with XRE-family HTH domain